MISRSIWLANRGDSIESWNPVSLSLALSSSVMHSLVKATRNGFWSNDFWSYYSYCLSCSLKLVPILSFKVQLIYIFYNFFRGAFDRMLAPIFRILLSSYIRLILTQASNPLQMGMFRSSTTRSYRYRLLGPNSLIYAISFLIERRTISYACLPFSARLTSKPCCLNMYSIIKSWLFSSFTTRHLKLPPIFI